MFLHTNFSAQELQAAFPSITSLSLCQPPPTPFLSLMPTHSIHSVPFYVVFFSVMSICANQLSQTIMGCSGSCLSGVIGSVFEEGVVVSHFSALADLPASSCSIPGPQWKDVSNTGSWKGKTLRAMT